MRLTDVTSFKKLGVRGNIYRLTYIQISMKLGLLKEYKVVLSQTTRFGALLKYLRGCDHQPLTTHPPFPPPPWSYIIFFYPSSLSIKVTSFSQQNKNATVEKLASNFHCVALVTDLLWWGYFEMYGQPQNVVLRICYEESFSREMFGFFYS